MGSTLHGSGVRVAKIDATRFSGKNQLCFTLLINL